MIDFIDFGLYSWVHSVNSYVSSIDFGFQAIDLY